MRELLIALAIGLATLGVYWLVAAPCTLGIPGSAATITLSGLGAPAACRSLLQSERGQAYLASQEPTAEPVICEGVTPDGWHYRVRDEGALKLVGGAMCLSLERRR